MDCKDEEDDEELVEDEATVVVTYSEVTPAIVPLVPCEELRKCCCSSARRFIFSYFSKVDLTLQCSVDALISLQFLKIYERIS